MDWLENWLDREDLKKRIREWLSADSKPFLVTVMDEVELKDIADWLRELRPSDTSQATLNINSAVTGFGLLKQLVETSGKDKFPGFMDHYAKNSEVKIPVIPNQIQQNMGSEIQARGDVPFNYNNQSLNVTQTINITTFGLNYKIDEFLPLFFKDLSGFDQGKTLFVIKIRGNGFNDLDGDFKAWFEDAFLYGIKKTMPRVILLCEKNPGTLVGFFDYHFNYNLKTLDLNDIIPVCKEYFIKKNEKLCEEFCNGAVDLENKINYSLFKAKLQKNI